MSRGERVKLVRKNAKLTMEAFGERIGLSKSTISLIESGSSNLTDQVAKSISNIFAVNYDWLWNGEGDMFAPSKKQADLAKLSAAVLNEPNGGIKSKIISLLANLPEEYWEMIADLAERLAAEPDEEG